MTVGDLDTYFRSILDMEAYVTADSSLNGLQAGDRSKEVKRVAFAVDACMETFRRAAEGGADLLFAHHGIFWGKNEALTGGMWDRVSFLIEKGLALYACHLPLDAHPEHGNNAVLCRLLGLRDVKPFGIYRGKTIGFSGVLPEALGIDAIAAKILPDGSRPAFILGSGKEKLSRVGVVSGDPGFQALDAITEGLDVLVTGEVSHVIYHYMEEARIAMVAAGHYATEIWGVKDMAERLSRDTGIPAFFIHLPTGL
jgi:dinuclear metal center YbgI/SA1388 family protein